MFDLEQAIINWRTHMLVAGIKTPVPLDELESHLRDDIERQMKLGANPQQAFENSVQQVGHADELKGEFKKTCEIKRYSKWFLLMMGIIGLVLTPILNLIGLHVFHRSDSVFFSSDSMDYWFWFYMNWIVFIILGLVLGLANGKLRLKFNLQVKQTAIKSSAPPKTFSTLPPPCRRNPARRRFVPTSPSAIFAPSRIFSAAPLCAARRCRENRPAHFRKFF